jgi:hypothetical protein
VCIRIQLSRVTVKDLHSRLQDAYRRDDMRLVRHTTVLLDLLVHPVARCGVVRALGLQPSVSLCLAAGLSAAQHGQRGLRLRWCSPSEVDPQLEETLGGAA